MLVKLKRIAYNLIYAGWNKKQLRRWSKIKNNKLVYVVDIDNTLTISVVGQPINHINPAPRQGMVEYITSIIQKDIKVVYLSARDFRLYDQTQKWLSDQQIYSPSAQELFLVRSSISKVVYLQKLVDQNEKIVFIDDLSYNHEKGDIMHYTDTLNALKEMEVEYLGIEFIKQNT